MYFINLRHQSAIFCHHCLHERMNPLLPGIIQAETEDSTLHFVLLLNDFMFKPLLERK